jgi:hypothetical protein
MVVSNLRLDQFLLLADPEPDVMLRSMSTRAPATQEHRCCSHASSLPTLPVSLTREMMPGPIASYIRPYGCAILEIESCFFAKK